MIVSQRRRSRPKDDAALRRKSRPERPEQQHGFAGGNTELVPYSSLLIYKPASVENLLRLKAADQLDRLHLTESWFKLIPSHVDSNGTVDLAVELFVQSNDIFAREPSKLPSHRPSLALQEGYWRLYARTISSLRKLMCTQNGVLSDEALLSCALLAHAERGMGFQAQTKDVPMKNTLSHLHGIQAILTARPMTRSPSELSFHILSGQQTLLYEIPVALGTASPFENTAWFRPPPSGSSSPTAQLTRLRLIGQRLLIDLPRLEMYVSRANKVTQNSNSAPQLWATRRLARSLLACEDEVAESTLLHRVKVSKTVDPENASSIPYSYTFESLADFEAGMYYWQSRLMVLRLCWRIARFDESLDSTQLEYQGVRVTKNLLMSWQYGEEQRMFGLIRFVFACKVIWGAVMDFREEFANFIELRRCLARRTNQLMRGIYGQLSEEKLDEIAKGLDGDGSNGPMSRLYQQSWPGGSPSAPP